MRAVPMLMACASRTPSDRMSCSSKVIEVNAAADEVAAQAAVLTCRLTCAVHTVQHAEVQTALVVGRYDGAAACHHLMSLQQSFLLEYTSRFRREEATWHLRSYMLSAADLCCASAWLINGRQCL